MSENNGGKLFNTDSLHALQNVKLEATESRQAFGEIKPEEMHALSQAKLEPVEETQVFGEVKKVSSSKTNDLLDSKKIDLDNTTVERFTDVAALNARRANFSRNLHASGRLIRLDTGELVNRQASFKKAASDVNTAWKDIIKTQIPALQSSWAGDDAKVYIDKVVACDQKVQAAIDTLNLLATTFERASSELRNTQGELIKNINNDI